MSHAAIIARIMREDNCSRRSAEIAVRNLGAYAKHLRQQQDEAAILSDGLRIIAETRAAAEAHDDECEVRRCPTCRALWAAHDDAHAAHAHNAFARARAAHGN